MHDNIVYRELMYFSKSLWIFSYICLEWEDFEIDLVVLLGMKIYGSIVRYLWYDTDGHYEPRNDCGNLFLAASESTKQLQFSANGKYTVIYNIYMYWYYDCIDYLQCFIWTIFLIFHGILKVLDTS